MHFCVFFAIDLKFSVSNINLFFCYLVNLAAGRNGDGKEEHCEGRQGDGVTDDKAAAEVRAVRAQP